MSSTNFTIEPYDQQRIDKFGFMVSLHGASYVVRHPLLRRKKHEGGNLSAILTAAEMDLQELERAGKITLGEAAINGKAGAAKPTLPGLKGTKPQATTGTVSSGGKTIAQAVAESPQYEPGEEPDDTIHPNGATAASVVAAQSPAKKATKKRSANKPKRSQGDWKTYQIGRLILQNPDKTPEDILALCKEAAIDTKIMTVIGLSRYFRLAIKVLADLEGEKGDDR